MANHYQSTGFWYEGIVIVRITLGVMLIFHGWQAFASHDVKNLATMFLPMSGSFPETTVYISRLVEFAGGLFLVAGLLTRLTSFILFSTFLVLTFVLGEGRIFSENEMPFMFALISLLFFFTGGGRVSLDHFLSLRRGDEQKDATAAAVSKRFGRYVSKG